MYQACMYERVSIVCRACMQFAFLVYTDTTSGLGRRTPILFRSRAAPSSARSYLHRLVLANLGTRRQRTICHNVPAQCHQERDVGTMPRVVSPFHDACACSSDVLQSTSKRLMLRKTRALEIRRTLHAPNCNKDLALLDHSQPTSFPIIQAHFMTP